jgi:hypothetical protein
VEVLKYDRGLWNTVQQSPMQQGNVMQTVVEQPRDARDNVLISPVGTAPEGTKSHTGHGVPERVETGTRAIGEGVRPKIPTNTGHVNNEKAKVTNVFEIDLQYWNEPVSIDGRRVYQRDDLFDPEAVDGQGLTNLQRMKKGRPPVGYDGKPINLHHLTQSEPGSLVEVNGSFHEENTKTLHGLTESGRSFRYSKDGKTTDTEKAYNRYRTNYWKRRVRDLSNE